VRRRECGAFAGARSGRDGIDAADGLDRASHDGKSVIHLRSMSMFDPNGIYSEINQHL
jgi:hypothetical protein